MKPLEVFALDANMNRATGSIPYTSLIWTRRYYECGEFQMSVPCDIYDRSWAYIYADDRPETGIIEKVEYTDDALAPGGRDTVTVSGRFLESILNRITFLVEQPEEKTIEIQIPKPKSPGIRRADMPTVFRDPDSGNFIYQNSSGDLIDQNGNKVDGDSDWEEVSTTFVGMTEVDETWGALPNDMMSSNYNYKTEGGKITISSWWGGERTYDIVMEDDKGNVYYKTAGYTGEGGTAIAIANSCATLDANKAYRTAKRAWDASGGVRYETITVKGPWQRTDTMEPITESDSIQQLLKWIQVFCGSTFKYEETDIEGIVKTLDPSLQYLGDFAYSVLQEVGASFRVVYGFVNNTMVLEVYQGKDRTHDQEAGTIIVPDPILPVGYTQLDYIESTGTQYIDTGIKLDNLSRVTMTVQATELSDTAWFFEGRKSSSSTSKGVLYLSKTGKICADYNGSSSRQTFSCSPTDKLTIDYDKNTCTINGETKTFAAQSFSNTTNMALLAANTSGSISGKISAKLYRCEVYSDGELVRDLYPARRDSDGVVGVYDMKSGIFLANAGSGTFLAGPESEVPTHEEVVQGNPWCVFSDTWGTISGFDASEDTSNYKNTCYVLYEYDEPSSFDSDGRPALVEVYSEPDEETGQRTLEGWKVPYETKRGYQTAAIDRPGDEPVRETYLDLRKDGGAPSCDSEWSRDTYRVDDEQPNRGKPTLGQMRDQYAQWPDALTEKGVQDLEQNYCVITNLDTGTVSTGGYLVEWDLGDKVDFGVSALGLEESARISEVEEVYESSGTGVSNSVGITIGERKLTIVDKAAMAAKRGGR